MKSFFAALGYGELQADVVNPSADFSLSYRLSPELSFSIRLRYLQTTPVFYPDTRGDGAYEARADWSFKAIPLIVETEYLFPSSYFGLKPTVGLGLAYQMKQFEQKSNYGALAPTLMFPPRNLNRSSIGLEGWMGVNFLKGNSSMAHLQFRYFYSINNVLLLGHDEYGREKHFKANLSAFTLNAGIQLVL